MEAPIWRKGLARSGPSAREALLMHAVARLVPHPLMTPFTPKSSKNWLPGTDSNRRPFD